jgi:hypothetical protein
MPEAVGSGHERDERRRCLQGRPDDAESPATSNSSAGRHTMQYRVTKTGQITEMSAPRQIGTPNQQMSNV